MNKNRNRHTGKVNAFKADILKKGKLISAGAVSYRQLNNSLDSINLGTIVRA